MVRGRIGSLGTGLAFVQGGIIAVSGIGLGFSLMLFVASLIWGRGGFVHGEAVAVEDD